ncbi:MAG: hypothetical protein N2690_10575 [Rhodocyclaceae bacterium]|nr:hypothetical protein [Rhodocyclaceae bacterium]
MLCAGLTGCLTHPGQLAKGDIDRVAELAREEIEQSLRRLAEKLYRRNPREWKKGNHASLEAAIEAAFAPERWTDAQGRRATDLILAGLREDYPHDRVAAFVGGLAAMLSDAFGGRKEFFMLDALDPQLLYHAARNVEIAAWKLAQARRSQPEYDLPAGTPLLFSNEMGPIQNLSFEREFGRIVGNLDLLTKIAAERSQRVVVKVAQSLATAIFLPIPVK